MNNKSTFRPLSLALAALIGSAFTTAALAVDNPLNSIASGVANWATQSTQQYVQDKVQEGVTQTVQSVVPGGTDQEPAPGTPAKPWVEPGTPAAPIPPVTTTPIPPPPPVTYVPPPPEPIALPISAPHVPPVPPPGPATETLASLIQEVASQSTPLPIRANQMRFHEGERLTLTVSVPQDGYLNVISIDSDGKATVLFPNPYEKDNKVSAGEFTLPTAKMVGKFTATRPYGAKTVAAFLTADTVNLYQTWSKGGDEALRPVFAELVVGGKKTAHRPELAGGSLSLRVCAKDETCL